MVQLFILRLIYTIVVLSLLFNSETFSNKPGSDGNSSSPTEPAKRDISFYKLNYTLDNRKENSFTFYAKSTINDFEGVSSSIDGCLLLEDEGILKGAMFYFLVPLDSVYTGLGIRDNIMKNDCLNTRKYPTAEISGNILRVLERNGKDLKVSALGKLNIHGTQKLVYINAIIIPSGEGYRMRTKFRIIMSDYNLEIPNFLFVTVEDQLEIEIDINLMNINEVELVKVP